MGIRENAQLPDAARRYLDRLSELVGTQIGIVSTGPDRKQGVFRHDSGLAAWLEG